MSVVNLDDFCAAVNYVARKTGDPDLAQDAAVFAWERWDECRGKPRPWLLAIAWQIRRLRRVELANEIDAMTRYAATLRLSRTREEPEQELAVLARELSPLVAAGTSDRRRVYKARARVGALLAA